MWGILSKNVYLNLPIPNLTELLGDDALEVLDCLLTE
jgi:hypothetical protein